MAATARPRGSRRSNAGSDDEQLLQARLEDPVHHHDTGEVMVITEGELWLEGAANGAGSVVYIPRDLDDALRAGDEDARFFRIVVD
jgi:hypothetical protein